MRLFITRTSQNNSIVEEFKGEEDKAQGDS
jgi:hypothetical protein